MFITPSGILLFYFWQTDSESGEKGDGVEGGDVVVGDARDADRENIR